MPQLTPNSEPTWSPSPGAATLADLDSSRRTRNVPVAESDSECWDGVARAQPAGRLVTFIRYHDDKPFLLPLLLSLIQTVTVN